MLIRLLTVLFTLLISSTIAMAQSSKISLEGRTAEKAAAGERVRVVVGFTVPQNDLPEGVSSDVQRRELIAITNTSVLTSVFGQNYVDSSTGSAGTIAKDRPTVIRKLQNVPGMALYLTRAEMEKLAADPRVTGIATDRLSKPMLNESTVLIGAPIVWAAGSDGADYAVAVLDTGSSHDHTMMTGKVVGSACFSSSDNTPISSTDSTPKTESFCPDGSNAQLGLPAGNNCPVDDPATNGITEGVSGCFHGSHVASTAMGSAFTDSTGTTIEGVARGANLVAVQVFTKFNDPADCDPDNNPPDVDSAPCILSFGSDQRAGLDFALTNVTTMKIASINMSLGGGQFFSPCDNNDISTGQMKSLIDQLRFNGAATVIAAGNESFTDSVGNPGCISTAITVGATTKQDVVIGFSNSSPQVDLLAPGVSIRAAYPNIGGKSYSTVASGTSMATPHVAGAFALLRSAHPNATVSQIEDALKATGKPILDAKNNLYKPRIRVDLANDLLSNGGGAGIGLLAITPADGFFGVGNPGDSPSFGTKTYTLVNNTGASLNWTVSADKAFVVLDQTGGALAAGATDTVVVSVDAANLAGGGAGSDDGTLTFTVGANTSIRPVGLSAFVQPPPITNNNFAGALPISGLQTSITGTSKTADKEPGEPNHVDGTVGGASNAGGASIWYRWTAPYDGSVDVSLAGSAFDTVLGIYTGSAVNSLTAVANNDDANFPDDLTSLVTFNAVKNTTYFIAVDGFNGAKGDVVVAVKVTGTSSNDSFASAVAISGTMGSVNSHNIGATAEAGEPTHGGVAASQSIWFDWTAPADGNFTFDTDGSDFDTVLAVYTGSALNALTLIAENDNQGQPVLSVGAPQFTSGASQVSFAAVSGTVYHIAVDGKSSASGLVNLGWDSADTAKPNLVTAVLPYARSVKIGSPATAFMTVINAGTVDGNNCFISMNPGAFQGGFSYQTTDGGNVAIGSPDTPVTITAGAFQNFVFAITPSGVLNQVELGIQANCTEGTSSSVTTGVNSFILSSAALAPADMLMIGLTAPAGGIVAIPGPTGAAAAAIATAALGSDATLTITADDGGSNLPLALFVCETNPATGACLNNPATSVTINSVNGETRTFSVFANASGNIPFDPANNRIFIRFKDDGGIVRGATNFAITTNAP